MNKVTRAILILFIVAGLFGVIPDHQAQAQGIVTQYQVTVNTAAHQKYGLYYPVTYVFNIPAGSSSLTAQYRLHSTDAWSSLPTQTAGSLFNGVNGARFDYAASTVYVSVAFALSSDNLFLRVINSQGTAVQISYVRIATYYDNRKAAVTYSLDDWDVSANAGFPAAAAILSGRNIHFTMAVITTPAPPWSVIQQWVNTGFMEVASHSRTHPCTLDDYVSSGYTNQVSGSKQDILAHLTLPFPYVPTYIEPCGYEDASVRQAIVAAGYLDTRGFTLPPQQNAFAAWGTDGSYQRAMYTLDTWSWPWYTQDNTLLAQANSAFNTAYAAGGIYHLVDHPWQGRWFTGSTLDLNSQYVANRADVWYAAFGELYLYHYVQERGQVSVTPVGGGGPTATITPIPTATNTPLPTSTNTPLPTATNTPLPTATSTPLPTATNTPLPTATNTPGPTSTNTPVPTATNTPLPTSTNTLGPTATNTPLPTATDTPLPTSTNTPLPTATNTPLPTSTNTPAPTVTNTPLPTATPTGVSGQVYSIWSTSVTPATQAINDPSAVELGVQFRSTVPGFITGVRFYKGSTNTGVHLGHIWDAAGTRLAEATFTNETTSGWQSVFFSSPVAITANTVYVASYYAPAGHFAVNRPYFNSGVTSTPLYAFASSEVSGGNGLYRYGASAFPNATYQSSNYWVDVMFQGNVPPSPTPTNTVPPAATNTPLPTATATLPPTSTPTPIPGADYSLWNASVTPGTPAINDPSPVELGMKFRSDTAGYIVGLRFYKGAANTGSHVGHLWDQNGNQLAAVTFTNETASGWQTAYFSTPVAITANTLYVISYFSSQGNFALDRPYFTAGLTRAPLYAFADAEVAGGNGVYNYGPSSFPNQTYDSSNYWVDPLFRFP